MVFLFVFFSNGKSLFLPFASTDKEKVSTINLICKVFKFKDVWSILRPYFPMELREGSSISYHRSYYRFLYSLLNCIVFQRILLSFLVFMMLQWISSKNKNSVLLTVHTQCWHTGSVCSMYQTFYHQTIHLRLVWSSDVPVLVSCF